MISTGQMVKGSGEKANSMDETLENNGRKPRERHHAKQDLCTRTCRHANWSGAEQAHQGVDQAGKGAAGGRLRRRLRLLHRLRGRLCRRLCLLHRLRGHRCRGLRCHCRLRRRGLLGRILGLLGRRLRLLPLLLRPALLLLPAWQQGRRSATRLGLPALPLRDPPQRCPAPLAPPLLQPCPVPHLPTHAPSPSSPAPPASSFSWPPLPSPSACGPPPPPAPPPPPPRCRHPARPTHAHSPHAWWPQQGWSRQARPPRSPPPPHSCGAEGSRGRSGANEQAGRGPGCPTCRWLSPPAGLPGQPKPPLPAAALNKQP